MSVFNIIIHSIMGLSLVSLLVFCHFNADYPDYKKHPFYFISVGSLALSVMILCSEILVVYFHCNIICVAIAAILLIICFLTCNSLYFYSLFIILAIVSIILGCSLFSPANPANNSTKIYSPKSYKEVVYERRYPSFPRGYERHDQYLSRFY